MGTKEEYKEHPGCEEVREANSTNQPHCRTKTAPPQENIFKKICYLFASTAFSVLYPLSAPQGHQKARHWYSLSILSTTHFSKGFCFNAVKVNTFSCLK